ncbi:hypothetical protein EOA50_07750 [Mesorhizobium sp. M1A.F.Ca.IN.020.30.1.1]|nr:MULTISPECIES: hypothetical protein [unclassified Mesorhizobium]RUV77923.1 hypothetical protein EOA50_07750 [Mesorhizobium sp. M1A.F.Ca.IN.020.30.1.1]RWG43302.1 MAG: hypothetical protein EOQ59_00295 [Mesorhizobium sp.]TIM76242.1 MAG: hypothetical protein E5Y44_11465 [Mesorhizobium sp.]TIM93201.1 MAG: hypothetical protein E5Y43_00440 [Mesorhizobium sp.]TIS29458.1 MAG: hypothetical protein E5X03_01375 [Mesorhizobium sp.]
MDGSNALNETTQEVDKVMPRKDVAASGQGRRKSRQSSSSNADEQTIDYDGLGIATAAVPLFEEAREMFASLGRKRTDEVFACGEMLAKVRGKSPSQEAFEKWSKRACGLTRRGAGNYIAVHNNLRAHRKVLVDCSVPAAAMYALAAAETETVASVVADLKAGKRPTVREIRAQVSGDAHAAQPDPADIAGADGLKALARAKVQNGVPILLERLKGMLGDIQAALQPHFEGKNVAKGALVAKLEHPARRARSELENLALFVEPNSRSSETWRVHPAIFPNGSPWEAVSQVLFKLGGREEWPDANDLGTWLVTDVVPAIEFAVGAKPSKGISTE